MSKSANPETGQVDIEVAEAVATICLDRPAKHNALTPEMLEYMNSWETGT